MSTYCSDDALRDFTVGDRFADVAYDCFGRDVRLIIAPSTHERLTPDEARTLGEALIRCADTATEITAGDTNA